MERIINAGTVELYESEARGFMEKRRLVVAYRDIWGFKQGAEGVEAYHIGKLKSPYTRRGRWIDVREDEAQELR